MNSTDRLKWKHNDRFTVSLAELKSSNSERTSNGPQQNIPLLQLFQPSVSLFLSPSVRVVVRCVYGLKCVLYRSFVWCGFYAQILLLPFVAAAAAAVAIVVVMFHFNMSLDFFIVRQMVFATYSYTLRFTCKYLSAQSPINAGWDIVTATAAAAPPQQQRCTRFVCEGNGWKTSLLLFCFFNCWHAKWMNHIVMRTDNDDDDERYGISRVCYVLLDFLQVALNACCCEMYTMKICARLLNINSAFF